MGAIAGGMRCGRGMGASWARGMGERCDKGWNFLRGGWDGGVGRGLDELEAAAEDSVRRDVDATGAERASDAVATDAVENSDLSMMMMAG